jgi:hypothetical protein
MIWKKAKAAMHNSVFEAGALPGSKIFKHFPCAWCNTP